MDEVRFSPTRTLATYDFLKVTHDGTKGEVTITLPLGTYTISEVQAPYGFVHTDHTYTVVLDWDDQYNDLVLAKSIIDHTQDGDVVYDYSIINVGKPMPSRLKSRFLSLRMPVCCRSLRRAKSVSGCISWIATPAI